MPRKKLTVNETDLFALKTLVASALTEAGKDKDFITRVYTAANQVMRTFGYTDKQITDALQKVMPPAAEPPQTTQEGNTENGTRS